MLNVGMHQHGAGSEGGTVEVEGPTLCSLGLERSVLVVNGQVIYLTNKRVRPSPPTPPPSFRRSSGEDLANSVAADGTGVYVAGTESIPRNSSSSGADEDQDLDTDAFVIKYNSTGGVLWKTSWGTSESDLGNGVAVDDGSGLVYVVGTTRGLMSPSGEDDGGAGGGGGVGDGVAAGANDAAAPVAGADSTVGVQAGLTDVFLTCLGAADGEIQWTRQFGSSSADVGNRVAVGPRGGVFVVGQLGDDTDPSLAGPRAFLAKYDYLGNAQVSARVCVCVCMFLSREIRQLLADRSLRFDM